MIGNDERSETSTPKVAQGRASTTQPAYRASSGDSGEEPESEPEWLFTTDAVSGYRARWTEIQAEFAADTQRAVRHADRLASSSWRS